jgi:hypothetical protein
MMKRKASATELEYQSPPHCAFHHNSGDEEGQEQEPLGYDLDAISELQFPTKTAEEKTIGRQQDTFAPEDPEWMRTQLDDLHRELESFPIKTDILDKIKGCTLSPLENEDLMLQFLRAEQYDTKHAARRILRHFEKKLDLFGPEKLGKSITMDDLDHDDLDCLTAGGFQPMGVDAQGRTVVFERFQNWRYNQACNLLRTIWYVAMSLVEDSDCARRGLVVVSFQTGPFSPDLFHRVNYKQSITILNKLIPAKLMAYHFCFDDIRFRMVWGLATIYIGKEAKQRAHDHEGTTSECMRELLGFGIDTNALPMSLEGKENNSPFLRWIEERKTRETSLE